MSDTDDIDDLDLSFPLTPAQQRIADLCAKARAVAADTAGQPLRKRTWEQWQTILDAVAAIDADHRWGSSPRWFYDDLDKHGLTPLIATPGNTASLHSMVNCLRKVIQHREAVEAWRVTLPPDKQQRWVSPRSVVKHCPACGGGDPKPTMRQNLMALFASYEDQQHDKREYQQRIAQLERCLTDSGVKVPQPTSEYADMVAKGREQEEQFKALVRAFRGGE
jgi:hypothetical protein